MESRTERGQVLLIAAVVLALIVLGLAVLLNAAVTTEVRSPDDPSTDIVESDRLGISLQDGGTDLIAHVNAHERYVDQNAVESAVERNVEKFGDITFESIGDRRATHLELNHEAISSYGTYVADGNRESDFTLRNEANVDESVRIARSEPAPIVGFELSLAVDSLDETLSLDVFSIDIHGEEEIVRTAFVQADEGDSVVVHYTTYEVGESPIQVGDWEEAQTCDANNYTSVHLTQFVPTGESPCHFNPYDEINPIDGDGYGLEFINPEASNGGYHYLVGSDEFRGVSQSTPSTNDLYYEANGEDHPYVAAVVWGVDIEIIQLARASERTVSVTLEPYADPANGAWMVRPW